jgi:hypothetical protein
VTIRCFTIHVLLLAVPKRSIRRQLGVKGCLLEDVGITAGVPQIAADLAATLKLAKVGRKAVVAIQVARLSYGELAISQLISRNT